MSRESLHKILHQTWFPFLDRFRGGQDRVMKYKSPDELKKELDFYLQSGKIDSHQNLEQILAKVVEYTPDIWSPHHLNYLYAAPDPVGLIGDWLVSLLNSNVHAYEASPVFALAEIEVIRKLAKMIGYGSGSDGIFCPGGSYSNMYAVYLALRHMFPHAAEKGLSRADKPVIFTSEQSHYSIDKAAALLGLGADSVRKIQCDHHGRMRPEDLARELDIAEARGEQPFFINATIGTTVLGAFDPLTDIVEIIAGRKIWLHTDAAWGGAALMSDQHREALEYIEHSDSVTWDLHKALRSPLLSSALLVKNGLHLKNSFSFDGSYLFHDSGEEENYHLGEKTPQCGRRGDAFKFWLMWKVHGKEYFTREVDGRFARTADAIDMIKDRSCFWLYDDQPDFWNVCFWYVPQHLRKLRHIDQCSNRDRRELEKITVRLYECMKRDGQILVNFARIKSQPAFIRLITGHQLTREKIKQALDIIESLGKMLSYSLPEVLKSGGDHRLELDSKGLNYIQVAPQPAPGNLVSRSSCSGSHISVENFDDLRRLHADIRTAKISFQECMQQVHDRIRNILKIDSKTSIITVPSGTDAEYIPLLVSKAYAGADSRVVNIVTGAGEIGTHSTTAAEGLYYTSLTPCGEKVGSGKRLDGIGNNVKVIAISQYHPTTGQQDQNHTVWKMHVRRSLSRPGTLVLLHIVDSSKLGRRMDAIDDVERLKKQYPGRVLVTIDSCQSRTDAHRTRRYLELGYMVMITGSKFEDGPPFSGAVIVPPGLTESLSPRSFMNFMPGLGNFITAYDLSGQLEMLRPFLPRWMNWGLMMRWMCAVANWENFRAIGAATRNRLIQDWVDGLLSLIEHHPELEVLSGGEIQPGAVGDRNTIVSVKALFQGKPLPQGILKNIYSWLYEDMANRLPDELCLGQEEKSALKRPFLIGQPVDLGNFGVLRIALGIHAVCFMEKHGVDRVLADDAALLRKLSLLIRYHDRIDNFGDAAVDRIRKEAS